MKANMKCSNCGADISNMNFSWGKRYWLVAVPLMLLIMALGFLPMIRLMYFQGDAGQDLLISDVRQRHTDQAIEIVGLITNQGSRKWTSVTVEAEFFDQAGGFLDEESDYLRGDISPGAKEHFKIRLFNDDESLRSEDTKTVVKIAGGNTSPF
jgi:hypothetical protein